MRVCKIFLILSGQLLFLVAVSRQAGDMCGMAAPDPMKTCVSVRLPWNPAPMYFCTDKNTFRYRNQCNNRFASNCGASSMRTDTLLVATPWDCCPLISYPDSCMNQQCPAPPLNRKCQTMEPSATNQPWECCNSYFCEENMTPETCHLKKLEPTCNMAPQGKTNCVAFIDPFGCCPKFQCDGEGKPGHCPAEADAMKFMMRFNSTNMMMMGGPGMPMMMPGGGMNMNMNGMAGMNMGAGGGSPAGQAEMHLENKPADAPPPPPPAAAPPAEAPPAEAPPARGQREREWGYINGHTLMARQGATGQGQMNGNFISIGLGMNTNNMIQCIGDSNCPGTMKCCSSDMNVYVTNGRFMFRNNNPTYGYCMEPVMNANMNTKTIKYTASQ